MNKVYPLSTQLSYALSEINDELLHDYSDEEDNTIPSIPSNEFLDECVAQTPAYLRNILAQTNPCDDFRPCSKTVFGFVLLADISGFTRLSSVLDVESLKYHINKFFTRLLDTVEQHGGDAVKLCGDAILIIWTTSISSSRTVKEDLGLKACRCGIELLNRCDNYEDYSGPSPVLLKLHCGMSAGELHCMCLGNIERMEFLISGSQLSDIGSAESEASAGQMCVSPFAYSFIKNSFSFTITSMGNFLIGSESVVANSNTETLLRRFSSYRRNSSLARTPSVSPTSAATSPTRNPFTAFFFGKSTSRKPSIAGRITTEETSSRRHCTAKKRHETAAEKTEKLILSMSRRLGAGKRGLAKFKAIALATKSSVALRKVVRRRKVFTVLSLPSFKGVKDTGRRREIMRFVHQSSRSSVLGGTGDFLAEIRYVVTIFVQILNLNEEFDNGELDRPQLVIVSILELLAKLGGALRQYVVDDKGCVVICSFGVPGFSHRDNEVRAVLTGLGIMDVLSEHKITCRIGISSGNAYCGYCGSEKRKEYVILGPSVNLAARLMSKAAEQQILISDSVYDCVIRDFDFQILDPVIAKGYDRPVRVYSPQRDMSTTDMDTMLSKRVSARQKPLLIDRRAEVYYLRAHIHSSLHTETCGQISKSGSTVVESAVNNKLIIEAPQGFGKTALVKYILEVEDTLLHNTPIINCHLASMGDSFETILHILREIFHVDTDPAGECNDSVLRYTNECNDQLVEVLTSRAMSSYADVWFVLLHREQCQESAKFAWRQRNNYLSMSCSQVDAKDPYESDIVRSKGKPDIAGDIVSVKHITSVIPLISTIGVLPESEAEIAACPENDVFLISLLEFVLREAVSGSATKTLIIEDMQWCDKDSYKVLLRMLKCMKTGCFIGTMRPRESGGRMPFSQADSVVDKGHIALIKEFKTQCSIMSLKPFGAREVRATIEAVLGPKLISESPNALSDGSILKILRNSDNGVPGSVVKLVQDLRLSIGKLSDRDLGVINNVAQTAVDGLSAESQVVLKVAAVCGTKFCIDLVDEVLQNMDFLTIADNLMIHLSELTSRRLIRKTYGVVPYLNQSVTGTRGSSTATYTFSDKCIREYVCLLMLESQKMMIHACVARVIEEQYTRSPAKFSQHVITYLAFHFAHTNEISKEVLYVEKAASQTGRSNLFTDSYDYYEHLVGIATGYAKVSDVLKAYYCSPRKKSPSLSLHNYSEFESVFVTKRYLAPNEFKGCVHIKCPAISQFLLMIYFCELSLLEYRRRRFGMSSNLFLFAKHIGGGDIGYKQQSIVTCSGRFIEVQHLDTLGSLYCAQAEINLMRGEISLASKHVSQAVLLLKKVKTSQYTVALALQSTVLMCMGKVAAAAKSMEDATAFYKNLYDVGSVTKAQLHYHSALKSVSTADFDAARAELYSGHMCHIEDSKLLQYELWNIRAWIDFFEGNTSAAEAVMTDTDTTSRSPCSSLYTVWCLQLRIVINTLNCKFSLAKNNLTLLENAQQGHYGEVYRHALTGILAVLSKHFMSSDITLRRKCASLLVFAAQKFSQRTDTTPVGVVCTFLTAYSCLAILKNDVYLHFDKGGGLAYRMRYYTDSLIGKLEKLSVGMPCLTVLTEALLMKKQRLHNDKLNWRGEYVASKLPSTFFKLQKGEYSLSRYSKFSFGRAFWCAEMFACRQALNCDSIDNEYYRIMALDTLQKYGVSPDHPFFD